jgi:hypothetical protein
MVNMTSLEAISKQRNYVKQANQNIKMATAKGIMTPWMVFKLVPLHASAALHLKKNDSLISTKFE